MAPPQIPTKLRELIAGSPFEGPTVELVDVVGAIFEANAMPFFPAFTDHGSHHVELVLQAAVDLTPDAVWEEELFEPADAAVLICAAMLHDLAMHVHPQGFVELVSEETRFKPAQWFRDDHVGRPADAPWPELWDAFQREARHFGRSKIESLFGPGADGVPLVAHEETLDPQAWREADKLLIGEFLRRHHARLSHEIALYGFPGLEPDRFPVLEERMPDLADAVGTLARSHNEPLRLMLDYLTFLEEGNKRPGGALLPFHMGVLRIADYIQLEADRAPPLLLRLKQPISPLSIEEWNKHAAISSIVWDHDDPGAIFVRVSARHTLRTHLALDKLLDDLQQEFDTTTAVLSVIYPSGDLAALRLTRQRVLTNLNEPSLQERLPYLARRAALRSDPDLFRLVVRDLYGNQPAVAGRELVQNAVDAMRARRTLEAQRSKELKADLFRELETDVVVSLSEEDDGHCLLRVLDRGIGMSPDIAVDYFLQAGASFGPTIEEIESLEPKLAAASGKAGRFGIGAFAGFLLGPEIEVTTRHVDTAKGVSFKARIDGDLVQLNWSDEAPVGTEVTIRFNPSAIPGPSWDRDNPGTPLELLQTIARFYRLDDPTISFKYEAPGPGADRISEISAIADVPSPDDPLPSDWRPVSCEGFDTVLWHVSQGAPQVVHNGIEIRDLSEEGLGGQLYEWSSPALDAFIKRPRLAIFDSRHLLKIALHRYGLLERNLPFEDELLESIGLDIVARGLALGPGLHPIQQGDCSPIFSREDWMPMLPSLANGYLKEPLLVLWRSLDPVEDYNFKTASSTALLRPESPIPWSSFPYRAHADISAYTNNAVMGAATQLARQLGCRVLASVVVDEHKPRSKMFSPHYRPRNSYGAHPRSSGMSMSGTDPSDRRIEKSLQGMARRLLRSERAKIVALTAFGDFKGAGKGEGILANPWKEILGGGFSRTESQRRQEIEIREEVDLLLSENRALQQLVTTWEDGADRLGPRNKLADQPVWR